MVELLKRKRLKIVYFQIRLHQKEKIADRYDRTRQRGTSVNHEKFKTEKSHAGIVRFA